jgi:ribose transport system substrate-binding protein
MVAPTGGASQPAAQASPWFPGDVIGGSGKPIAKTCGPNGSYQIAYSQSNFAEPYRAAADAQMTKLFATVPQFHLTITDGTGDSNVQNTQLNDDITKGVDLVMTSPQASTPGTPAVTAIYNAGIPVILLDRGIDTDAYTAFIGGDNVAIGKMAGEYVGKNLLPSGGDVAIVEGDQTTQPALDRQNGFKTGVAEFPNIHVVAAQTANWRKADAETVTKDMLTAHPTIKFIYFANDEMESGGAIAIADAGLTGKVLTGGTDGLVSPAGDNGMYQVSSGQQAFTIIYPTNASEAFAMVKDILLNCATSVPKTTHPAVTLVDKTNVARVTADLLAAAAAP